VQQLVELRRSQNLLWNLTLRELRSKYRRSVLGWAWSMLNPLSSMLIYSFVFSVVFGAAAPVGDPSGLEIYALYLLCGILPWGFFTLTTNLGMAAITANAGLVRKVAFARETLVFSQVIFCFVQFTIEMGLLAVAMLFFGSHFLAWLPVIILHMLLLAVFASGIALALAVSSVYFRDLRYLWTIVIQVMFFATPIIYSPDRIEGKLPSVLQFLWDWNPAKVFVMQFRQMLYSGASPDWGHFAYLLVVSVVSFVAGWSVFQRLSRRIAEEL
jgi:ABC-type polysaccharide/polyol phosphate export permease